jgi:enediyne biosynthesis protein E4
MNIRGAVIHLLTLLHILGCDTNQEDTLFLKLDAAKIGIGFKNEITETDTINVVSFTNIYNGGGVGIADFNGDGKPDLFFTGNMVSSRLYLNITQNGKIQFLDISDKAGINTNRWCNGVSIADINDDGWPDIYISVSGSRNPMLRQNYLYIHQGLNDEGLPFFEEMAEAYGLADQTYSTQAVFFDYDGDNDLDCFVAVNFAEEFFGATVNAPSPIQKTYSDKSDRLYRNLGPGENGHPVFEDISKIAGVLYEGYTLGVVVNDINMDGWPDIYLSNDFLSNDIMYINQGDGTFTNEIGTYLKHSTFAGMGMDISDFNNDSWPDIFVLDMMPANHKRQKAMQLPTNTSRFMANLKMGYHPQYNRNTLQLNNGTTLNGDLSFSEIGQLANIHHTDWSWTVLLGDLNNDGYKDILISNGYRRDIQDQDNSRFLLGDNSFGLREDIQNDFVKKLFTIEGIHVNNYLFENNQDLSFTDKSMQWGFNEPSYSHGGVFADIEGDGDLDIIINNLDDYPYVYKNSTQSNEKKGGNFLKVRLSDNNYSARTAGTKVSIIHNETSQFYQHYLVRGYLSSLDPEIHFGLGSDSIINKIEVLWPDGTYENLVNVDANQTIVFDKNMNDDSPKRIENSKYFHETTSNHLLRHRHFENVFDDFEFQPLLIHKYAQNGPGMAVSDLNGDGLDDLFIGGSTTFQGSILLQQENGSFKKSMLPDSEKYEDMGAIFFDADGDGDTDLYVVTGGSEYSNYSEFYLDRLYINDGKGNFTYQKSALPAITSSGSCVIASDFDNDGRIDLFIGGRVSPGRFPTTPESYLLKNISEGGIIKFIEVTDEIAPGLKNIGMVTSALWTDYNNDNLIDLLVVGEWMPVTIFKNHGSVLKKLEGKTGLEYSNGWWNSVMGADFDKDGDIDYLVGNMGLNSSIKASVKKPFSLYAADFDRDGKVDPLFFNEVNGVVVPFHPRSLLANQINYFSVKFPTYTDYSQATLETVLEPHQRAEAQKLFAYTFSTSFIENLGQDQFKITPLPNQCQVSPIFGMTVGDFNGDGNFDALLIGNSYATSLNLGIYNASTGIFLKGGGDGKFAALPGNESGFYVDTDAKSMVQMTGANSTQIIVVASNNDSIKVFEPVYKSTHIVPLRPEYTWARLHFVDGTEQKMELYKGSGYLSADGTSLFLNDSFKAIDFYSIDGKKIETVIK